MLTWAVTRVKCHCRLLPSPQPRQALPAGAPACRQRRQRGACLGLEETDRARGWARGCGDRDRGAAWQRRWEPCLGKLPAAALRPPQWAPTAPSSSNAKGGQEGLSQGWGTPNPWQHQTLHPPSCQRHPGARPRSRADLVYKHPKISGCCCDPGWGRGRAGSPPAPGRGSGILCHCYPNPPVLRPGSLPGAAGEEPD